MALTDLDGDGAMDVVNFVLANYNEATQNYLSWVRNEGVTSRRNRIGIEFWSPGLTGRINVDVAVDLVAALLIPSWFGNGTNLGLESPTIEVVSVYPNPTRKRCYLHVRIPYSQLEVFNVLGQRALFLASGNLGFEPTPLRQLLSEIMERDLGFRDGSGCPDLRSCFPALWKDQNPTTAKHGCRMTSLFSAIPSLHGTPHYLCSNRPLKGLGHPGTGTGTGEPTRYRGGNRPVHYLQHPFEANEQLMLNYWRESEQPPTSPFRCATAEGLARYLGNKDYKTGR